MHERSKLHAPVRARAGRYLALPGALLFVLCMLVACSGPVTDDADAVAATPLAAASAVPASAASADADAGLRAPMQAMVIALMSRAQAEGRDFGPAFPVPAAWVFDPEGELHERIENVDALGALDDAGFRNREAGVQDNALPLDSVLAAIGEQAGAAIASGDGRWTVLTLLANPGCEETCPRFAAQAQALEAGHAGELRSIVLTLEH